MAGQVGRCPFTLQALRAQPAPSILMRGSLLPSGGPFRGHLIHKSCLFLKDVGLVDVNYREGNQYFMDVNIEVIAQTARYRVDFN